MMLTANALAQQDGEAPDGGDGGNDRLKDDDDDFFDPRDK
jgi:hypothetical protein